MRIFLPTLVLAAGAFASIPVRDACSEDASVVASVQATDAIQVRHGVVGESVPCYAVSVTQAGAEVRGYILGSELPAIQEFEKKRSLESRVGIPPPPPPPPAVPGARKAAAPPPDGPPFEDWTGLDMRGKRVQIVPGDAKVTLVTFWSAPSGTARRYVQKLNATGAEFRAKGVRSVGLIVGVDKEKADYWLDDLGLEFPQALDRQRLAAKYNVDAGKGTTLVLDARNHIIATSSNPVEIRAAVASLLAP